MNFMGLNKQWPTLISRVAISASIALAMVSASRSRSRRLWLTRWILGAGRRLRRPGWRRNASWFTSWHCDDSVKGESNFHLAAQAVLPRSFSVKPLQSRVNGLA
jgi:hypothetical protein